MEELDLYGSLPNTTAAEAEAEGYGIIGGVDYYSEHFRIMSIIPKAPALVSILASVFIIQNICKSPPKRRKMTNQIMIGLSLADVGYAATIFLGTWPAPEGQVYGSMGNIATCSAQGFFNLFFFQMGAFFNAALALTFVLMVRFHWNEDSFNNRSPLGGNTLCSDTTTNCINYYFRTRWLMLLIPPFIAITATYPALSQEGFNYTGQFICSGGPWPPGCGTEDLPCQRGDNMIDMFQQTDCFIMCFWITILQISIIMGCMVCLVRTVLESERSVDKYQFGNGIAYGHASSSVGWNRSDNGQAGSDQGSGHSDHLDPSITDRGGDHSSSTVLSPERTLQRVTSTTSFRVRESRRRNRKRTRKVAIQGILYVCAFLITSLGFLLMDVPKKHFSEQFDKINAFVCPLQGLLNALVFLRPRYLDYQRKHPEFTLNPVLYCYRLIRRLCTRSKVMMANRFQQKRNSNVIEPNDDSQIDTSNDTNNNEAEAAPLSEDGGLLDTSDNYDAAGWLQ